MKEILNKWLEYRGFIYEQVEDLSLQKKGVDIIVTLPSGKTINVEVKVRRQKYKDVALETKSCIEKNTDGAITKLDQQTDYFFYIINPLGRCYIYEWNRLQQYYFNITDKIREAANDPYYHALPNIRYIKSKTHLRDNKHYTTECACFERDDLLRGVGKVTYIAFEPFKDNLI
jgi:hypothetical protein